ncbi:unnamed protein product [Lactuca saligna]|uniref:Uncharacterized protein n=1 Tax=Lactuca saligna TaxID=75948 RepID=A0AA35ZYC6_LACSI|nr:unnamed protein product [Lactuca saligna]
MYQCVSGASKIIGEYKKCAVQGPKVITPEMQHTLDEADKTPKKQKTKGDSSNPAPSSPKPKHVKKSARKVRIPSSTSSESEYDVAHQRESKDDVNRNDQEVNFSITTPPISPTSTFVPITIAPCLPPISTQPPTSIQLQNPIFTQTMTTTTTTTGEPFFDVNASDVGAKTSGFETFSTAPPTSQPHNESDIPLSVDGLDFDTIQYSPFSVQGKSDDDAPVTQKDIWALIEKLESRIASSTASSSHVYSEAEVKSMLDTLVKEHAANLDKANKAVENSTRSCLQATEKIDKLIFETKRFMIEINTVAESNTSKVNDAIDNLNASLRKERFQEDLAIENKIIYELALRTTQLKSQSIKLKHVNKEMEELKYERVILKSCVGDVNSLLSNLLQARDPILNINICRHLADKLRPALALLNCIEGVSKAPIPLKQGGKYQAAKTGKAYPLKSGLKGNVASGSKGKKPMGDDDEDEELQ